MNYKGKKILIVGFGRSGLAAAKFLLGTGAHITVTDSGSEELFTKQKAVLSKLNKKAAEKIVYSFGSNPEELFTTADLVVLSPGVPLELTGIVKARKKRIPIICEMELGLREITGKVIAVTGTNGKSTTVSLIGNMLKKSGRKTWVGGNLGNPLIGDIQAAKKARFVVLEFSSYQLELTPSLKPFIAVWLNMTPDHLDRYASFEHYVKAKTMIGAKQTSRDYIVFNKDDAIVVKNIKKYRSKKCPFSVSKKLSNGAWYEGHILHVAGMKIDTRISVLTGVHNKENIAASVVTMQICGLDQKQIENGLKTFNGLPHRVEFVREVAGVKYFNDSKGTNVGAVVRSVEGFDAPVILIAGGQDKNTGYKELRGVAGRIKRLVLIGEAAGKIRSEMKDLVRSDIKSSLEEAVEFASKSSAKGDIVLLSPACSSFDMFKDYKERGEKFVQAVFKLERSR